MKETSFPPEQEAFAEASAIPGGRDVVAPSVHLCGFQGTKPIQRRLLGCLFLFQAPARNQRTVARTKGCWEDATLDKIHSRVLHAEGTMEAMRGDGWEREAGSVEGSSMILSPLGTDHLGSWEEAMWRCAEEVVRVLLLREPIIPV